MRALDLGSVIARVLVILVEREGPRNLLGSQIDLEAPGQRVDRVEHALRYFRDGRVGHERGRGSPAGAVFDNRRMPVKIECDDQCPRAVRRGQRRGLPPPRRQSQRGVLELWLGRSEANRQLAEQLGMCVQRVARLTPRRIRDRRPRGRDDETLLLHASDQPV